MSTSKEEVERTIKESAPIDIPKRKKQVRFTLPPDAPVCRKLFFPPIAPAPQTTESQCVVVTYPDKYRGKMKV